MFCETCKFWSKTNIETTGTGGEVGSCQLDPFDISEMKPDQCSIICGHDGGIFYGPKYGCIHHKGE